MVGKESTAPMRKWKHEARYVHTGDGKVENKEQDAQMPPSFPPEEIERIAPAKPSKEDAADDSRLVETEQQRSRVRGLVETVGIVAVALLVSVVIKTFFLQAFYVPSGSMETTLMPNDRIAVNPMADTAEEIHRGDVVVFVDPGQWLTDQPESSSAIKRFLMEGLQATGLLPEDAGQHLVKRVIGVGGDRVKCCSTNGKITVNGTEITETYLDAGIEPSQIEFDVTVPEGHLWVMGDNRSNSRDSRYHLEDSTRGFVPVENVVGRAWAIFYPFGRAQKLDDVSDVFTAVK